MPEAERRVLLERGHPAEHPLVGEVRVRPLHLLYAVRAVLVYQLAQVFQDRAGEVWRLADVRVKLGASLSHALLLRVAWPNVRKAAAGSTPKRRRSSRSAASRAGFPGLAPRSG